MADKKYGDKDCTTDAIAVCPFYHYSVRSNLSCPQSYVVCESLLPYNDNDTDYVRFRRQADYRLHTQTYCCGCYEKCERYRAIMAKYEEGYTDD